MLECDDSLRVMLLDGFRADVVKIDYVKDFGMKIVEEVKKG